MQGPPQQSLLPDGLWKFATHVGALGIALRVGYSLFTQATEAKTPATSLISELRASSSDNKEEIETLLLDLLSMLDQEEKSKTGSSKNVICDNLSFLIEKTLKGVTDTSILLRSIKIISKCMEDEVCKAEFARLGGIKILVTLLQNAHEASNMSLMEEIAATLNHCTDVPIEKIVLPSDVPTEANGAYALSKVSSLRSMLRILDPNARPKFLHSMISVFGSVCALRNGALIVNRGLDGKKGIEFFIPLLDHTSVPVVSASIRVIQSIIRHDMKACTEMLERGDLLAKFIELIATQRDQSILGPILHVIAVCIQTPTILRELILRDGLDALFTVWCNGKDAHIREYAERIIREIEADPTWTGAVARSREVYRTLIQRRAEADEKEKKQEMQAMQQQRMFQQMMMEQLGISPEMMEESMQ